MVFITPLFKKDILSLYIIFTLITVNFICVLVFKGIRNDYDAEAAIIIVDSIGNGDYTSIQVSIDNATSGDIIHVWAGIYYENVVIDETINFVMLVK